MVAISIFCIDIIAAPVLNQTWALDFMTETLLRKYGVSKRADRDLQTLPIPFIDHRQQPHAPAVVEL